MTTKLQLIDKIFSTKKISKTEALSVIVDSLAESHDYDALINNDYLISALANLVPAKSNNVKNYWDLACKFAAKQYCKYYLNYVYVTEDAVVASNGHILMMCENIDKLPAGFYRADNRTKSLDSTVDSKYPDFSKFLELTYTHDYKQHGIDIIGGHACNIYSVVNDSNPEVQVLVNIDYIKLIPVDFTISIDTSGYALKAVGKLDGVDITLIVMPMRL